MFSKSHSVMIIFVVYENFNEYTKNNQKTEIYPLIDIFFSYTFQDST